MARDLVQCRKCSHHKLFWSQIPCNNCEFGDGTIDHFAPKEKVTEKTCDKWEPKEQVTNTNLKGSSMKTQEIYSGIVTENVKVKDELGQIESIKKRVIYSAIDIPAFDEDNAKAKALIAANKVTGDKAIKDLDEVEVKVRPFLSS